jgi:hypothetical protein
MHFLVYRVTNVVNGKIYVGCHKTANVEDGYMGSGHALAKAVAKYGIAAFVREVLFDFSSAEEMFAKEQELVELGPHSYNLKMGGQRGSFGYRHKPEVIAALRAYRHSAETIAKFKATKTGKAMSPEVRAAIAERNRAMRLGKPVPIERREKISATMKGRPANNKGKPHSAETKEKISAANKGKHKATGYKHSVEWKTAMSCRLKGNQFRKGFTYTPEQRAEMSASRKGKPKPPGYSEKMKELWRRKREAREGRYASLP